MSTEGTWRRFPFAAIVGQERMKLGLLLNAIDPRVGGVLIRGNKGTAKSTAVRALAALLPPIDVVEGCAFRCAPGEERAACPSCGSNPGRPERETPVPIVELPVGATEDRLTGSLDIEAALQRGAQAFQPGLLAAAHRGVLYVDEVNLLNDHLVDVLLDAAAMGRNFVEREGISASHPARFILIGTMNPEEGDLRPQLLDRFGLMVEADDGFSPAERAEVVRRRIAFESDPQAFAAAWANEQTSARNRLLAARELLPTVTVPDLMLEAITTLCAEQQVDGLRADIVIYRAASALAAWHGRTCVTLDDVREAAKLALAHRQRRQPFEDSRMDERSVDDTLSRFEEPPDAPEGATPPNDDRPDGEDSPGNPDDGADQPDETAEVGRGADFQLPDERQRNRARAGASRRAKPANSPRGRVVGARVPSLTPSSIEFAATVRAAATHQHARGRAGHGRIRLEARDVREKVRESPSGRSILFVVDASGSMGAQQRMSATKGAILSLLKRAYQDRDRVGMVTFRGTSARLVLPLTRSVELAHRRLRELPTGGRTPLAEGLVLAGQLLSKDETSGGAVHVVLVTDGRANAGNEPFERAVRAAQMLAADAALTVIDTEAGPLRLGLAARLAREAGGECIPLPQPDERSLVGAARSALH